MLDSVSSGDGDSDIVYCCVVMVDVEWSDWRVRMVTNELVEGMTGYVTYALGLLTEAWFGASVKRYYEKTLSFWVGTEFTLNSIFGHLECHTSPK